MSGIRFVLRSPNGKAETAIHLVYRFSGNKFVYPLQVKVLPKYWDKTRQRVRNVASAAHKVGFNNRLNEIESYTNGYIDHCKISGKSISMPDLKRHLNQFFNKSSLNNSFTLFVEQLLRDYKTQIVPKTGKPRTDTTQRSLRGTWQVLQRFEEEKYSLLFDSITLEWYHDFVEWCNARNNSINNTGKHIKNVKSFMSEAVERELTKNLVYQSKRFVVLREDVEDIYLNLDELDLISKIDLTFNPMLDKARDLFIIGAFTGLRVSDFNNLTGDNIITRAGQMFIEVLTQKTGQKVIIPCSPYIRDILAKYNGAPPSSMADQNINRAIKEVGRMVGINTPTHIKQSKNGLKVSKKVPKYELIKTHTARRSFCTNVYLTGEVSTAELMQISGHKTEVSFMRYLKMTKEQTAMKIAGCSFLNSKLSSMKVVE